MSRVFLFIGFVLLLAGVVTHLSIINAVALRALNDPDLLPKVLAIAVVGGWHVFLLSLVARP